METAIQNVIENCAQASHAGTVSFAEVVGKLMEVGVESYHADFRNNTTTYYMPSGLPSSVPLQAPTLPISDSFDSDALQAAIRGALRGEVKYPEFLKLSMAAGCVGYIVWIQGRQVTYFGRRGETHIERFPSSN